MSRSLALALAAVACALAATPAAGESAFTNAAAPPAGDLGLDELINIQVTSVSKRQTSIENSPAAIAVVTGEDIRRLGITSIPEALRLVPGLDVARIDGNEWAISSRGYNDLYAKRMLVLVDGRTVYSPASAGVFWNVQDTVMEDLDRIEVIRGPGATLWGANAVNGVINVITRSARDTQGGLISTSVGTEDQPSATIRYGGEAVTNLFYRVYLKCFNRGGLSDSHGNDVSDDWEAIRTGFRMDWEPTFENTLTLQGDYYYENAALPIEWPTLVPLGSRPVDYVAHNTGGNALGRWTHQFSETSQLSIQAYFDHVAQGNGVANGYRDTYDSEAQYRFALGERNDVIFGAGYRYADIRNDPSFYLTWTPEDSKLKLANTFLQDEITLAPDLLRLTLGTKLEHNSLSGWALEPGARLLWTPTEQQAVWASVSRAARTPSLFEMGTRINAAAFPTAGPPGLLSFLGNPNLKNETLTAYELGYRIEPIKQLSFDATAFYDDYDHQIISVANPPRFEATPFPPHILLSSTWRNAGTAQCFGLELDSQWRVTEIWRLAASYSWLHPETDPASAVTTESPQQQAQFRSYLDLPYHLELNGALYYVDQTTSPGNGVEVSIPSYIRADLGVVWTPSAGLEIGLWGQNLLQGSHPEAAERLTPVITEPGRGVLLKVTWRF